MLRDIDTQRAELGGSWLIGQDAARMLQVTAPYLTKMLKHYLTHKSTSQRNRAAFHNGYAYSVADLERVCAIMTALGCSALEGCKILHGVNVLGEKKMLPYILRHLELDTSYLRSMKP